MSNAITAFGTILSIDNGSGVYTDVAEIKEISGPSLSRNTIDVTNHASASAHKEFIAGLADAGEITLGLSWLPNNTQHTQLKADFDAGTLRNFKITPPSTLTSKIWTAAGIITKFDPQYPIDGAAGLQVTIKVSGKPTFA
jgi:predicted secreted protein